MIRLLLIFFVSYLAFRWLARTLFFLTRQNTHQKAPPSKKKAAALNAQPLTSCPQCQTYFQASQGTVKNGQIFCSVNCANLSK